MDSTTRQGFAPATATGTRSGMGYIDGDVSYALTSSELDAGEIGYDEEGWLSLTKSKGAASNYDLFHEHQTPVGVLLKTGTRRSADSPRPILTVSAMIDKSTPLGKQAWSDVQDGKMSLSYAFDAYQQASTKRYRNKFKEVSLTTDPAKSEACIRYFASNGMRLAGPDGPVVEQKSASADQAALDQSATTNNQPSRQSVTPTQNPSEHEPEPAPKATSQMDTDMASQPTGTAPASTQQTTPAAPAAAQQAYGTPTSSLSSQPAQQQQAPVPMAADQQQRGQEAAGMQIDQSTLTEFMKSAPRGDADALIKWSFEQFNKGKQSAQQAQVDAETARKAAEFDRLQKEQEERTMKDRMDKASRAGLTISEAEIKQLGPFADQMLDQLVANVTKQRQYEEEKKALEARQRHGDAFLNLMNQYAPPAAQNQVANQPLQMAYNNKRSHAAATEQASASPAKDSRTGQFDRLGADAVAGRQADAQAEQEEEYKMPADRKDWCWALSRMAQVGWAPPVEVRCNLKGSNTRAFDSLPAHQRRDHEYELSPALQAMFFTRNEEFEAAAAVTPYPVWGSTKKQ